MRIHNLSGVWEGAFHGPTNNRGRISLTLTQQRDRLGGTVDIADQVYGPARYDAEGTIGSRVQFRLLPRPGLQSAGLVSVSATLNAPDRMSGRWESTIQTWGEFQVQRRPGTMVAPSRRVFVVHGHDEDVLRAVCDFLGTLELEPVVLREETGEGRTIIEKFEANADVEFAVVLLTPDDCSYPHRDPAAIGNHARQNVVLELGFFWGALGRKYVATIVVGDVDIPSDFAGFQYIRFDAEAAWQERLARELAAALPGRAETSSKAR